jgi:hypothetical protein
MMYTPISLDINYWRKRWLEATKYSLLELILFPWLKVQAKGGNTRWRQVRKLYRGGIQ